MCVPRWRCTPLQSMHMNNPRLMEAQVGSAQQDIAAPNVSAPRTHPALPRYCYLRTLRATVNASSVLWPLHDGLQGLVLLGRHLVGAHPLPRSKAPLLFMLRTNPHACGRKSALTSALAQLSCNKNGTGWENAAKRRTQKGRECVRFGVVGASGGDNSSTP